VLGHQWKFRPMSSNDMPGVLQEYVLEWKCGSYGGMGNPVVSENLTWYMCGMCSVKGSSLLVSLRCGVLGEHLG